MFHSKRFTRAGVAALLLVSVILLARSVRAAEAVAITGFSLTCSSAQATYRVIGETNPAATASLQAYNASAALLGSASGQGYPDGTYIATVNFPPQPEGTSIYVVVSVPPAQSFSLNECIARNGGLPPEPTSEPGRGGTNPPPATSLCEDPEFFSENQEACLRELSFNDLGIQLIQLFFLCASGSLPGLALMVGIGRYLIWRRCRSRR